MVKKVIVKLLLGLHAKVLLKNFTIYYTDRIWEIEARTNASVFAGNSKDIVDVYWSHYSKIPF